MLWNALQCSCSLLCLSHLVPHKLHSSAALNIGLCSPVPLLLLLQGCLESRVGMHAAVILIHVSARNTAHSRYLACMQDVQSSAGCAEGRGHVPALSCRTDMDAKLFLACVCPMMTCGSCDDLSSSRNASLPLCAISAPTACGRHHLGSIWLLQLRQGTKAAT